MLYSIPYIITFLYVCHKSNCMEHEPEYTPKEVDIHMNYSSYVAVAAAACFVCLCFILTSLFSSLQFHFTLPLILCYLFIIFVHLLRWVCVSGCACIYMPIIQKCLFLCSTRCRFIMAIYYYNCFISVSAFVLSFVFIAFLMIVVLPSGCTFWFATFIWFFVKEIGDFFLTSNSSVVNDF